MRGWPLPWIKGMSEGAVLLSPFGKCEWKNIKYLRRLGRIFYLTLHDSTYLQKSPH